MSPAGIPSTLHYRTPTSDTKGNRTYIIYFITGNPGLIGYYTIFLSHLFALLSAPSAPLAGTDIIITGRSLSGFSVSGAPRDPIAVGSPPFTVAQQLDHSELHIRRIVDGVREEGVGRDARRCPRFSSRCTALYLSFLKMRGRRP